MVIKYLEATTALTLDILLKEYLSLLPPLIQNFRKKDLKLSASTLLISGSEIRSLNFKYRKKDKETDVLSFPFFTFEDLQEESISDPLLLLQEEIPLGEIFICEEVAYLQAEEQGVTLLEELLRLSVHGVLHLLGFDHEGVSEKTANRMFSLQEKLIMNISGKI